MTPVAPLLQVDDLRVEFPTRRGTLVAVDGVSFSIAPGEVLGVVGESGAGKSITGAAIIGLIDPPGRIGAGQILLGDRRIDNLQPEALRRVRGREIGAVFQDPLTSLNPLYTVGRQLAETISTHLGLSASAARARALELLTEVGIAAPERRIDQYPHQFSGGMRQRIVIALALAANPKLIIADEPTTALDVSIQAQIIALLKRLCREHGTAVMLITHDMGVIAETADRVAVMYAGPHRRNRSRERRDPSPRASVYARSDGVDPVDRRRARDARADRWQHATPDGDSDRLRVPSALPAGVRALPPASGRHWPLWARPARRAGCTSADRRCRSRRLHRCSSSSM